MKRLVMYAIWTLICLATVLVLTACAPQEPIIVVATAAPTEVPEPTPVPTQKPAPTRTPQPVPTARPLTENDFTVELIILEKQCFGSAGCLITFEPMLHFEGTPGQEPRAGDQYTLIYEVSGLDDGTGVFNLGIEGHNFNYNEEVVSTPTGADLVAVVTRLLER